MRTSNIYYNRLYLLTFTAIITILVISTIPQACAEDNVISYQLANEYDGDYTYTLTISVPQSLNEHYQELNHLCLFDFNYPKFITPFAVQPIAECLRQIYVDDEAFTNQVLTIVHQIPYEITAPVYYPAETIIMNKGDCDLLSLIAASILKAGGLEVVLFRYSDEPHMNIGVHLTQPPQNTRTQVFSAKYENKTYYIAECTSTDWQNGWRVGECPKILQNASVVIINTKYCEQTAPAQIYANIEKPDLIPPIPIEPPTFPSIPLPATPNTPIPTPSTAPFVPPSNLTATPAPTPSNQPLRPEETPTLNPTVTPDPTPTATANASPIVTPTQEPIQTASPSTAPATIPTLIPSPEITYGPTIHGTQTTASNLTAEPTNTQITTTQPTQQQAQITDPIYDLTVAGIIITLLTGIILLKKMK